MATEPGSGGFAARRTLEEESNAPMMAIFGGVFGLLLVFLVLVNMFSAAAVRERLERAGEDGLYRIERPDGGAGFVVLTFPDSLRIVETGEGFSPGFICSSESSGFINYVRRVYENQRDQIVFFILEGSVPVMAEARECIRTMWPGRIVTVGWVIADNELMKSVTLNDIPDYIREYVESNP